MKKLFAVFVVAGMALMGAGASAGPSPQKPSASDKPKISDEITPDQVSQLQEEGKPPARDSEDNLKNGKSDPDDNIELAPGEMGPEPSEIDPDDNLPNAEEPHNTPSVQPDEGLRSTPGADSEESSGGEGMQMTAAPIAAPAAMSVRRRL